MARTGWVVALRPSVLGTRDRTRWDLAGRGLMAAGDAAWPVPLPVCQDAGWALVPLLLSSQPHLC